VVHAVDTRKAEAGQARDALTVASLARGLSQSIAIWMLPLHLEVTSLGFELVHTLRQCVARLATAVGLCCAIQSSQRPP
jgi:hypothetical protein